MRIKDAAQRWEISDYRLASSEYYYIDKTMMIKDFIDERPMVSLFTRPRRFGKTLNMDMLRTFFEKTSEDTSIYFKDKKIWSCGQKYRDYQGKYPVIFVTFKDVKFNTWDETLSAIKDLFSNETHRHTDLQSSDAYDEYDIPVQQGHMNGYYDKVILFMRNLFSGGLKDNRHLSFGFLTGILRVEKESIFSGLNNLTIKFRVRQ